jgi:cell division protein FtsB
MLPIPLMRTPNGEPSETRPRSPRAVAEPGRTGRRAIHLLIVFIACVVLADALAGEKGLLQTRRVRQEHDELVGQIARLRRENARLREEARRLREDPRAIEEIARRELGLARPGEIMFIVKDVPAPSKLPR